MAKKEYTNDQYKKFMQTPFNSNFGCSKDDCIDYFWKHEPTLLTAPSGENLNHENFKNTYLPAALDILGKNAYVIFIGILINENATYGWINYTARSGTPMEDLRADCNHIMTLLTHNYPIASSAPETGYAVGFDYATAGAVYNGCKNGDIGKYYMPATLAGNACVWANAWSQTQYFGNAYDTIIDMVKAMGGDPFGGGGGSTPDKHDTGGDTDPKKDPDKKPQNQPWSILPSRIYLNSSMPQQLLGFIKLTRFQDMLTINYDITAHQKDNTKPNDSDIDANSGKNDPEPATDKIAKIMAVVKKLRGHYCVYSNARPARDPLGVGYTDCSGMVGWCIRNVYPTVWNNGYINTGTMYTAFKRMGLVIWEGSMDTFNAGEINKVKQGDIIIMGQNALSGAGNSQHTVLMLADGANGEALSQEGGGTIWGKSISGFTHNWWHPSFTYFCVVRPK